MKKIFAILLITIIFGSCVAREEYAEPNFDRFVSNVVIHKKSPYFITYEYKNVRVDEVAMLAAMYCQEQNNRQAYLRDIILHKNHSRRATFDCVVTDNK